MPFDSIAWIADYVPVMMFVIPSPVEQLNCLAAKTSSRSSMASLNLVLPDLSIWVQ